MCSIAICCSNIITGYNILIEGCGSSAAVVYECYEAGCYVAELLQCFVCCRLHCVGAVSL